MRHNRRSWGEEGQDRGVGDGFRPPPERRTKVSGMVPASAGTTVGGWVPACAGTTNGGAGMTKEGTAGGDPSRRLVFQWVPACAGTTNRGAGTTVYVPSAAAGGSGRRGPLCLSSSRPRRSPGRYRPRRCSPRSPGLPVRTRSKLLPLDPDTPEVHQAVERTRKLAVQHVVPQPEPGQLGQVANLHRHRHPSGRSRAGTGSPGSSRRAQRSRYLTAQSRCRTRSATPGWSSRSGPVSSPLQHRSCGPVCG